jgi:outer membrane protein assembly factor BamB
MKQVNKQIQKVNMKGLPNKVTCVTAAQTTYLTNDLYEIDIEDGLVVEVRKITQSPDISGIVLMQAADRIGNILSEQRVKDYK